MRESTPAGGDPVDRSPLAVEHHGPTAPLLDPEKKEPRRRLLNICLVPQRVAFAVLRGCFRLTFSPLRALCGQTIPYSGRRHIIVVPEWLERALGTAAFYKVCATACMPCTCALPLKSAW